MIVYTRIFAILTCIIYLFLFNALENEHNTLVLSL
ncbi:hypothetical protein ME3_00658 [Bartonella melophagi K-2C]|uniref:Uncharacterized protein n=1 Tax=Bartonella melophagi K-2C TaxID=1094557 RepID=J0QVU0_9HYPH|nr:hypothetical protein ME3_00658 [Bartonella melophagi K-2C]